MLRRRLTEGDDVVPAAGGRSKPPLFDDYMGLWYPIYGRFYEIGFESNIEESLFSIVSVQLVNICEHNSNNFGLWYL